MNADSLARARNETRVSDAWPKTSNTTTPNGLFGLLIVAFVRSFSLPNTLDADCPVFSEETTPESVIADS